MQRTYRRYRALAALGLAGTVAGVALLAALAPGAGASSLFGAEPLAEDSAVALAQPVDGTRWGLVVVERLQPEADCWHRQADGLVGLGSNALSNDALCNRLQSSSGYSLRAADQDLASPWRLRIEVVGQRLELQALNPTLPEPITIGTAPLVSASDGQALPAFSLNPGWSLQKRSYQGRLLSHVYVSSRDSLSQLQARADGREQPGAGAPGLAPALPPLTARARGLEAGIAPAQVISLQVVPFRGEADLTASN
ncbi:MAG: DUF3747 domain-containing protein [Cyanobacteriota bacterium]